MEEDEIVRLAPAPLTYMAAPRSDEVLEDRVEPLIVRGPLEEIPPPSPAVAAFEVSVEFETVSVPAFNMPPPAEALPFSIFRPLSVTVDPDAIDMTWTKLFPLIIGEAPNSAWIVKDPDNEIAAVDVRV